MCINKFEYILLQEFVYIILCFRAIFYGAGIDAYYAYY